MLPRYGFSRGTAVASFAVVLASSLAITGCGGDAPQGPPNGASDGAVSPGIGDSGGREGGRDAVAGGDSGGDVNVGTSDASREGSTGGSEGGTDAGGGNNDAGSDAAAAGNDAGSDATAAGNDAGSDATAAGNDAGGDACALGSSLAGANAGALGAASVLQHHLNPSRDGVYVDPVFKKSSLATVHRDTSFVANVKGDVYAQPLYVQNGPGGKEMFIVATESNHLTAFDGTGATIWDNTFGAPATANLPCGNINPLGITGTPYIDATSTPATIYFDTMTSALHHVIHAVSLVDGKTEKAGFPLDVAATVSGFNSSYQNQRGALQMLNGTLYVPYGGHWGDCGQYTNQYHGWIIGVPVASPSSATGWATPGSAGGMWSPGGVSTDGTSVFASTGNTENASAWEGGEAVIRFGAGPMFSANTADYFTPASWNSLDQSDTDLGSTNPILFDMACAQTRHLVAILGKDSNLYLLNRDNLGGIGGALSINPVANGELNGAPAVYRTALGTYVAFHAANTPAGCPSGGGGNLGVARISTGAVPTATVVWCASQGSLGSPMATTTDGAANAIVWDANDHLFAYDGDTGATLFSSAGANDPMAQNMDHFNTPIAANGRIVVATSSNGGAATSHLYVFKP